MYFYLFVHCINQQSSLVVCSTINIDSLSIVPGNKNGESKIKCMCVCMRIYRKNGSRNAINAAKPLSINLIDTNSLVFTLFSFYSSINLANLSTYLESNISLEWCAFFAVVKSSSKCCVTVENYTLISLTQFLISID